MASSQLYSPWDDGGDMLGYHKTQQLCRLHMFDLPRNQSPCLEDCPDMLVMLGK